MVTSRRSAGAGRVHMQLFALVVMSLALIMLALSTRAMGLPVGTPTLPDGRGYEMVSSSDNADGNVYQAWPAGINVSTEGGWTELPFDAAPDGNAVTYTGSPSNEGGTGHEGANEGNQYLARRGAGGQWEASNITPPSDEFFTKPQYQGFSDDLTESFLTANPNSPLVPGAPAKRVMVPYLRNNEGGAYTALMTSAPPDREWDEFGAYGVRTGSGRLQPVYAGSSRDFSHVLFMTNDALTGNAVDGGEEDNNLYDYSDGALSLVNVLPEGKSEPNAVFGGPIISPLSSEYNSPDFSHAISEDGIRIFWTGQGSNRNLYMREGDTRTVQIDKTVGGGGQFWTATPDGSRVLFTKGGDLYEYSLATEQVVDLTPGGEVDGVVGASQDLSYVYFVANTVLAAGARTGDCDGEETPVLGKEVRECALYVSHRGDPTRFIGMLSDLDNYSLPASFERVHDGVWQASLANKETEVTPDGLHLLFGSVMPLTGYQNESASELFVYDYEGGKLSCVSCSTTGGTPATAYLPVSHQVTYSLQWMSNDGSRVFFNSFAGLVPQDTNGVTDVYEWERDGSGDCTSEGGCIYLITGGTGREGSYLVDASATGNDVFFTTRDQLTAEDQNENIDIYDAHVGAVVPPSEPQCFGTGCQGLPSAPPVFATPSSVTYDGVGNFAPSVQAKAKTKKAVTKHRVKKKRKKTKRGKKGKKAEARHAAKKSGKANHGRGK